jgi:hypothetical protein
MRYALRQIPAVIANRVYSLIFRSDWRPIRFLCGLVWFGEAVMHYGFAESPNMISFGTWLYRWSIPADVILGGFFLYIALSRNKPRDSGVLYRRYWLEFYAMLVWIWMWFVDWYSYHQGYIRMDIAAWDNHTIDNAVVTFAHLCAFLNAISLAPLHKLELQLDEIKLESNNG